MECHSFSSLFFKNLFKEINFFFEIDNGVCARTHPLTLIKSITIEITCVPSTAKEMSYEKITCVGITDQVNLVLSPVFCSLFVCLFNMK